MGLASSSNVGPCLGLTFSVCEKDEWQVDKPLHVRIVEDGQWPARLLRPTAVRIIYVRRQAQGFYEVGMGEWKQN